MRETRDQLESSRARWAYLAGGLRVDLRRTHERLRLLEDAIRRHAEGKCACNRGAYPGSSDECLMSLYRRVPKRPRKKLR